MSLYPVTPQIKSYFDQDGTPLNGYLYFGNPGTNPELTENRVQVYWDAAGLQPTAQPIRVSGGFAVRGGTPANVYAVGDFAATAKNLAGQLVYTVPNSTDIQLALAVVGSNTADAVLITDAGGYYAGTEVETALQEVGASLAAIVLGAIPTGVTVDFCGTTAPTGYVLASGRTIGNVASNATERNNADTATLYAQLWNASTNTELPIQDSAGNPTTRGASAAADFAANKRLPLPDCRGRLRAGKDNMGGSTASRITSAGCGIVGTTQFATGGTQTHTLVEAELAAHTHTGPSHTHPQTDHVHDLGSHTHTITHTHDISHTHTYNAGATALAFNYGGTPLASAYNTAISTNTGAASTSTSGGSSAANTGAAVGNTGSQTTSPNTGAGGTGASGAAGSGTAHLNVQPMIMFTAIIKL